MNRNWTRRYIIFVAVIIALTAGYFFYSHKIYGYVCDEEQNIPGCFLAGRYYWEKGNQSVAFQYFRKACHKEYLRGCDLSLDFIESQSSKDQVIRLRNSYCKNGFKSYCIK